MPESSNKLLLYISNSLHYNVTLMEALMNQVLDIKAPTYFTRLKQQIFQSYSNFVYSFFIFVGAPGKEETPPHMGIPPREEWFGLKAYTLSSAPTVRILGWLAAVTLSFAIFLVVCLTVSRCFALWDLWFEAIRRPDRESSVQRFLRIFSFWLMVAGIASWILCAILS